MAIVYLNGAFIPEAEATISVFDRGFLFADSIYDAICVYKNHFVSLEQHLKRLQESVQAIDLSLPIPVDQLKAVFIELVERNAFQENELTIYLQITRGVQIPRAYLVAENIKPTLLITCSPTRAKSKTELMQGLSAITLADKRRQDCYIKSTSLLPSVIAANQAKKAGFDEALLVYNNNVLESTSGNLFIVNAAGEIITPPLQPHILAGVTRDIVLKLAQENGFSVREANISMEYLLNASEVWITGSIKGICPIRSVDGKTIGSGEFPAKVWQQFYAFYQNYKEAHVLQGTP